MNLEQISREHIKTKRISPTLQYKELQSPKMCFQGLKVILTAKRFHLLEALPSFITDGETKLSNLICKTTSS